MSGRFEFTFAGFGLWLMAAWRLPSATRFSWVHLLLLCTVAFSAQATDLLPQGTSALLAS